jgi:signal peptidase I
MEEVSEMSKNAKFLSARNVLFYGIFILIFLCIRSSVFASYNVPSESMNPTIVGGDFFFANKLAYRLKFPFTKVSLITWSSPERGDIIVFKTPMDEGTLYTKRVIGIPGDVIETEDGHLIINGERIERRFLKQSDGKSIYEENLFGRSYRVQHLPYGRIAGDMKKVTIPDGYVFVLGDNRDNSFDSRHWGLLPMKNIEGELFVRWFSIDRSTFRPRLDRISLM